MKLKLNKKWLKIGLSILGIGVIASPIISLVSCSNSSSKSEWMNPTYSPYTYATDINRSIARDILVPFANQHPDMIITSPGKQHKIKLKDIDFTPRWDHYNEREWICLSSGGNSSVPEIDDIQWSFPGKKVVMHHGLVYKYSTDTDFLTIRKLDFKLDGGLDAYEAISKKVLNLKFRKIKEPDFGHEFYAKLDVGRSLKYLLSHQWEFEKGNIVDDNL